MKSGKRPSVRAIVKVLEYHQVEAAERLGKQLVDRKGMRLSSSFLASELSVGDRRMKKRYQIDVGVVFQYAPEKPFVPGRTAADVHDPDLITHHLYQKADLIVFGNGLLGLDGQGDGCKGTWLYRV